jgi:hypothetical protein
MAVLKRPSALLASALTPTPVLASPLTMKLPAFIPMKVFLIPKLERKRTPPFRMFPDVAVEFSRFKLPPTTSSLAAGVVVPMPMFPPDCVITESMQSFPFALLHAPVPG